MTLKSALEDVLGTTLAAVAGVVGKIEYVASLRDLASGAYSHWGLSRAPEIRRRSKLSPEAHRLFISHTPAHSAADTTR